MTTPLNERRIANAIRVLAMDAVQQANSGHPGAPMGMADIADVVWREFLNHNPTNPQWANRDRFVLSNGHGSMLQYALLHLTGYELSVEDLKGYSDFMKSKIVPLPVEQKAVWTSKQTYLALGNLLNAAAELAALV